MNSHKNALLTAKGREPMVRAVLDTGLSLAAVGRLYRTTPKTVGKWVARFRAEGGERASRSLFKAPFIAKPNSAGNRRSH